MTKTKNIFWVVYNKKGKVIAISKNKSTTQEEALRLSKHRFTEQTFTRDWGYLVEEGYTIEKSMSMTLGYRERLIDPSETR